MNKSRGFGLAYVVVILAVLAAVGIGVYILNKDKTEYSSNPATNIPSAQTPTQNQQKPEQGYLIVKEWGIKLPLSEEISDAYYVDSPGSQTQEAQFSTVWLGIKSMDDIGHCSANNANGSEGPLGSLMRTQPDIKNPVSGELYVNIYTNGTTLNGYYYGYGDWITHNPCTDNPTYKKQLEKINTAFAEAAKNIIAE